MRKSIAAIPDLCVHSTNVHRILRPRSDAEAPTQSAAPWANVKISMFSAMKA